MASAIDWDLSMTGRHGLVDMEDKACPLGLKEIERRAIPPIHGT